MSGFNAAHVFLTFLGYLGIASAVSPIPAGRFVDKDGEKEFQVYGKWIAIVSLAIFVTISSTILISKLTLNAFSSKGNYQKL
tara:strand:- start:246 stop:491 length:246 start_codon:yes stop_codon:yes gene_type:complete